MDLLNTDFGWQLTMDNGQIRRIEIDFQVRFVFEDSRDSATITIESPFFIKNKDKKEVLNPEDTTTLAPVLPLFLAHVQDVIINKTGNLKISLKGEKSIEVFPDDQYEAWQIVSSLNILLVCSPGGEVAFFDQRK